MEIGRPIEEILICCKKPDLRGTPMTARLLDGWWEAKRFLTFKPGARLPPDLDMGVVLQCPPGLRILQNHTNWSWSRDGKSFDSWELTSTEWCLIFSNKKNLHTKLNHK
ncbi:hypothetical protein R1sor_019857 [Riccia sorocarpa]|uniref:Uncharacterized protein n=1 Tax=Riccia sorocarpa TaxID=122646 RepID=A0ABD3IDN8_9MARC